jgi:hypothetical protein
MNEPQDIIVPATVFVPCPAIGFKNASVSRRCPLCPAFQGFTEVQASGEFDKRYRVNCAHVTTRQMLAVEIE